MLFLNSFELCTIFSILSPFLSTIKLVKTQKQMANNKLMSRYCTIMLPSSLKCVQAKIYAKIMLND